MSLWLYQIAISFAFPMLAVLAGGCCKKLAEMKPISPSQFRLGVEISLAGACLEFTLLLGHFAEIYKISPEKCIMLRFDYLLYVVVATLAILLYLIVLYQKDEIEEKEGRLLVWPRVILTNLIGSVPLGFTTYLLIASS